jgi:hypothetical protein
MVFPPADLRFLQSHSLAKALQTAEFPEASLLPQEMILIAS